MKIHSVWMPTNTVTGEIDRSAEPLLFDDKLDCEPHNHLLDGWEWREYHAVCPHALNDVLVRLGHIEKYFENDHSAMNKFIEWLREHPYPEDEP